MKHEDIQELLGAYALDAVDPDEAQSVESHLAVCPRCREEVRDHREVASLLAYSGAAAPPGMWDRLVAALDEPAAPVAAPRLAPVTSIESARRHHGRSGSHALLGVAAALLLVLGLVGGLRLQNTLDRQKQDIDRVSLEAAMSQAAAAASTAPGSRVVHLGSSKSGLQADAVIAADGTGYLWSVQLPAPSASRAYQLWAVTDTAKVSVGVLDGTYSIHRFTVPAGGIAALAITTEPKTGSAQPTTEPVLVGTVSA